jgi:hypothetical protein
MSAIELHNGLKSDIAPCPRSANNRHAHLFAHLVGTGEQRGWNVCKPGSIT